MTGTGVGAVGGQDPGPGAEAEDEQDRDLGGDTNGQDPGDVGDQEVLQDAGTIAEGHAPDQLTDTVADVLAPIRAADDTAAGREAGPDRRKNLTLFGASRKKKRNNMK